MEMLKRITSFPIFSRIGFVCRPKNVFAQANGVAGFDGLNLVFFSYVE
jgi:hypothetical protein